MVRELTAQDIFVLFSNIHVQPENPEYLNTIVHLSTDALRNELVPTRCALKVGLAGWTSLNPTSTVLTNTLLMKDGEIKFYHLFKNPSIRIRIDKNILQIIIYDPTGAENGVAMKGKLKQFKSYDNRNTFVFNDLRAGELFIQIL